MTILAPVLTVLVVVLTIMPAITRFTDRARDPIAALYAVDARPPQRWSGGALGFVVAVSARRRGWVARFGDRRLRRRGIRPDAVASWCDSIASRVRGGTTLREALRSDLPSDQLLSVLTRDVRLGLERGDALTVVIDRAQRRGRSLAGQDANDAPGPVRGIEDLDLALSVLRCASEVGGSPAAPLDSVAAALRLRSADRQERASHSAQARLSAHVLTVVPLGTLALFIATTPDVRSVLTTSIGAGCVLLGLVLNAGGWIWMRHVIGIGA